MSDSQFTRVVSVRACLGAASLWAMGAALGCSSTAGSGTDDSASTSQSPIDANDLMEDADLTGCANLDSATVQQFLSAHGSALASYQENGASAAQIIVSSAQSQGINPVYLLARIQGESGLVSSGTLNHVTEATGCACPDGQSCNAADGGFTAQVTCTALLMAEYLGQIASNGQTVSGWAPGRTKATLDPCSVTPANAATAAIYTYTPWVGPYSTSSCGSHASGGGSLMATIFRQYMPSFQSCTAPGGPPDTDGGGGSSGGGDDDAGEGEPPTCVAAGVAGTCMDTDSCGAMPGYVSTAGLCPGAANIECCTPPPDCAVDGTDGSCLDTSTCASLGFTSTPGFCAGAADIECCTP